MRSHKKARGPLRLRPIETAAAGIPPGKVRCPLCDGAATITKNGRARSHADRAGVSCPWLGPGVDVHLDELPPVIIRPQSVRPTRSGDTARLDAGTPCDDCGKWLPGERHVCGQCSIKRNAERGAR